MTTNSKPFRLCPTCDEPYVDNHVCSSNKPSEQDEEKEIQRVIKNIVREHNKTGTMVFRGPEFELKSQPSEPVNEMKTLEEKAKETIEIAKSYYEPRTVQTKQSELSEPVSELLTPVVEISKEELMKLYPFLNQPLNFWISGVNFKEFKFNGREVITAFLTAKDPGNKPESIHVVEYSALEHERAKVKELTDKGEELCVLSGNLMMKVQELEKKLAERDQVRLWNENEELRAKLEKAVKMAEFYSHPDHYEEFVTMGGMRGPGVLAEKGNLARQFLKEMGR